MARTFYVPVLTANRQQRKAFNRSKHRGWKIHSEPKCPRHSLLARKIYFDSDEHRCDYQELRSCCTDSYGRRSRSKIFWSTRSLAFSGKRAITEVMET